MASWKRSRFARPTTVPPWILPFVQGEEVTNQIEELKTEFRSVTLAGDDMEKLKQISECDARFDIFHFEQCEFPGEEEMLDPGGLLIVLETVARLCDGVGLDPQSQALM